jgi:hypothetical protein
MYLATARSLLDGLGFTYYGEPFYLRPPGFSVLLLPILATVGASFAAIHTMVSLFGILGVAAMHLFQRTRIGWPAAAAAAAALWLLPEYQRLCNQVMSDVPGVALLLVALLVERWTHRSPSVRRQLLLGATIGLFAYVRTLVVLVVPAVFAASALERLLRRGGESWGALLGRRLLPLAVGAALVQLPWSLANRPGDSAPPADQTARFSYASGMWRVDEGDPASPRLSPVEIVRSRLPERAADIAGSLGSSLQRDDVTAGRAVLAAAILLSSLWVLGKRRAPADFLVVGLLAIFSIYFGFKPRLLLPVWVIAWPALFETLGDGLRRTVGERAARRAVPAAILLWAVVHFHPHAGWDAIRAEDESFRARCDALAARLPEDARLGAHVGWHWAAYLDRPVFGLRYHTLRVGDPGRGLEEMVDKYRLNTVIVEPDHPGERGTWRYLLRRYGDGTEGGGFERIGSLAVVRVRP